MKTDRPYDAEPGGTQCPGNASLPTGASHALRAAQESDGPGEINVAKRPENASLQTGAFPALRAAQESGVPGVTANVDTRPGNASLQTGASPALHAAQESGVPSEINVAKRPGNASLQTGAFPALAAAQESGGLGVGNVPDDPPFWHDRGYLPHFECASAVQHITFHLADSLPSDILDRLQVELATVSPDRLDAERRQHLEAWIDAGHGSCLLREPEIATLVEGALHFFDGQRYRLLEWVVMPNHVHVLIEQLPEWTVAKIVASWKKFTARKIVEWQHAHTSAPGAVWHREYWDRFIRNQDHYQAAVAYIRSNPVKAGLVKEPQEWPWGSARKNPKNATLANASLQTGAIHALHAAQESGVPSETNVAKRPGNASLPTGASPALPAAQESGGPGETNVAKRPGNATLPTGASPALPAAQESGGPGETNVAKRPGNASLQTGAFPALRAAQESGVPSGSGIVLDILRGSLHDGPGIRTTVFLKGCPLACLWCHNPESQARAPVLMYQDARCVRCGACAQACPLAVHAVSPQDHLLDRSRCLACGRCAAACPAQALEIKGRTLTVAQVMAEVLQDADYYRATGGGLTLSGGEPMLQLDFTVALLQAARERGIHTVLETCGWAPADAYDRVRPLVDLFLFDWKGADTARHAAQTGVPNEPIRRNLDRLARAGARLRLRCPMVPGVNDSEADLACIAGLSRTYSDLAGVEIMPYHHMGNEKARRVGLDVRLDQPDADAQTKAAWRERLQALGCRAVMMT